MQTHAYTVVHVSLAVLSVVLGVSQATMYLAQLFSLCISMIFLTMLVALMYAQYVVKSSIHSYTLLQSVDLD